MTVEEIARFALNETVSNVAMNLSEKILWFNMRDIYRDFRSGKITKAQGEIRKKEAIKEYEQNENERRFTEKYMDSMASMWIRIENAAITYTFDKTIEHADAFKEAVYGVIFKDVAVESKDSNQSTSDSAPPAQTTKTE